MRTFKIISILLLSGFFHLNIQAQMSDYKFNQLFEQAFAQIVDGDLQRAIPTLTKLHLADPEHAQVAYLLGMCQIRSGSVTSDTERMLESAAEHFDHYHQSGRVEDKTAPTKVWFYLAQAREQRGKMDAAVTAYRNYMSCIPQASLDHKRSVISEIKRLKNEQLAALNACCDHAHVNSQP
jgi:tetratricopeptide (TPR) repeat protein